MISNLRNAAALEHDDTGAPVALLAADRTWEDPLIEGPSNYRQGTKTILLYSGGWYEGDRYAVGYATCEGPAGPCTKKTLEAPLVKSTNTLLGPGGQELFDDAAGHTWMASHAWTAPFSSYAAGGARSLRIARVDFVDGMPVVNLQN